MSLITLLAGTAVVLFAFGKFDFLGWKGRGEHIHPRLLPGKTTESQRATLKYFAIVSVLFLLQVLVGGATAHYRAEPGNFYGIDFSTFFPEQPLSHLAPAVGHLLDRHGLYCGWPVPCCRPWEVKNRKARQRESICSLLLLLIVALGSLLGEMLGIYQLLGKLWFWFGHQGWEYLDLGRAWQVLLAVGLFLWLISDHSEALALQERIRRNGRSPSFSFFAALAIPLFYLPAMFFGRTTHFSVVDTWRFWIIHLWVEGFFELFVTVMVAVLFYKLGMVARQTALRIIYLDAILFLGAGVIGTAHHWYWTGQSNVTMALAAIFSAMEVVPLTLLTLDAWDFIKLSRATCDICEKEISIPHKWTFYFMMAVGFWNFVGAGIFGFLINLPIVSYFEVGTHSDPQSRTRGHDGCLWNVCHLVHGLFPSAGVVGRAMVVSRKVCSRLFLGAQYRSGAHGHHESFSRRSAPASGRIKEWLLARQRG